MDIGGLKRDDFTAWVPFLDAEVLIRYVGAEELRAIQARATTRAWDRKSRPVETLDWAEANRLLGRAAVRGWKGITSGGEEFPYSEENCDFLMARWHEFARFVGEACVDLQGLVRSERSRLEKNSGLTSGQGSISRA
ncbi:MAG: hypothetical protein Kow0025_12030 [Thermodesulfovibrionales bacterium]